MAKRIFYLQSCDERKSLDSMQLLWNVKTKVNDGDFKTNRRREYGVQTGSRKTRICRGI